MTVEQLALARPRCPRGHFLPTTGTCRCTTTRNRRPSRRRTRLNPDLLGQRIPPRARLTTIRLTGSYL